MSEIPEQRGAQELSSRSEDISPEATSAPEASTQPDTSLRQLSSAVIRARIRLENFQRRHGGLRTDIEARQFETIRRAYGRRRGPEVLAFGDSAMFWIGRDERDPRRVADLLREKIAPQAGIMLVYGPGYHARIVNAFLAALEDSQTRPRVVVVPTSVIMTLSAWCTHPKVSYKAESASLLAAALAGSTPRRVARESVEVADAYDRLPADSLQGQKRTLGELRMINDAPAETPWQKELRHRARFDYFTAESLDEASPGLALIRDLGKTLWRLDVASLAYILPVHRGDLVKYGGQAGVDQTDRSAALVADAFIDGTAGAGRVVNAIFDAEDADFVDPLHLAASGRRMLASRIVDGVRELL